MAEIFTLLFPYGGISIFLISLYIGIRKESCSALYDFIGIGIPIVLFFLAFSFDLFFGLENKVDILGMDVERLLFIYGAILIFLEGLYIYLLENVVYESS
ncbi:MAG: hypothetical protein ACOC6U_01855 [Thermoplasmatota archaeon]